MNDLINQYALAFGKKDLETIDKITSDDIKLIDPAQGEIKGKEKFLQFNKEFFNSVSQVNLEILNIFTNDLKSKGVLEFKLSFIDGNDQTISLEGVDIIDLSNNKIDLIKAYINLL